MSCISGCAFSRPETVCLEGSNIVFHKIRQEYKKMAV